MRTLDAVPGVERATRRRSPAAAPRRPWIPVASAAALGAVAFALAPAFGATGQRWFSGVVVVVLAIWPAWVDERTGRLPNRLVGALAAFGGVQAIGALLLTGDTGATIRAAAAAAAVGALYAVLCAVGGVGFGDVKFAAALTLAVGGVVGPLSVYLVALAIVISAVRMILRMLRGVSTRHPHGASLALGGICILGLSLSLL